MKILKGSAAKVLPFLLVDSTDHLTGKTGLSPTVTISKNGAAFAAPAGAVTEISSGWYQVAGNATDSNTAGPLLLHATGTGADVLDLLYDVEDPTIANATLVGEAGIKKNVAVSNFMVFMTDSTNHAAATGLTVTAQRSLDGAAFANCANAVSEVASGWYKINLAAGDLNGNTVALKFTATGADQQSVSIVTG